MTAKDWVQILATPSVAIVGFVIAYLTYRVHARRMRVDHILHIVSRLEEDRQDRHTVYDITASDSNNWTDEQRAAADRVCRGFDLLGYFQEAGIVPDSFLKDLYAIPVVRCWKNCKPFVDSERIDRKQPSHFHLFQELAKHCDKLRPDALKETGRG
jgi:hypothetical protein